MAEASLEIVVITQDVPGLAEGLAQACPTVRLHAGGTACDVLNDARGASVLIGLAQTITPALVAATPGLRWIQALTTGVDPLLSLDLSEEVIVTSARGVHGPQMSEMAFTHMLALARDLPRMVVNQHRQSWDRWPQRLLLGKTVVLVGVGAISEELAHRCKVFGMRVIGISDARTTGNGFDEIRTRRDLVASAAEADFLIVMAASTPQTRHLINADVLDALPAHAFLINLARGPVVDEAALIERLQSRRFAGAGLDVFNIEPLPADSPLWRLDNVLVTPHLGGMSDSYAQQLLPLVVHNLRAFAAGEFVRMQNRISIAPTGARA
ncbi:D-2-hydroxyacid dehydrogenase [Bradyrhizobium archetypum]|uniref:D-2-hydroxyacid dehydrogenase n=1 Tax=Bradyrhizobium archetypum TaxID=2721160 RepID=A0A7Y4H1M0_9BRAD|nr:D-2-hydroxyacid dehydrogenase [Bradyrhizobium archetypum]NOJ45965.1 D-2-hydroxyacid dehydrogenase [Bradyrhizobium archetypum]